MHPRNIYKTPPNFKDLAIHFPNFRKYVKIDLSGKARFDFLNQRALCELTKTLLLKDFNLDVEIPPDRLIPTLPLRLNYILWVEDLLSGQETINIESISGIDIGTGASCVYALLAAKKGWTMLATELDPWLARSARRNVKVNWLSEKITVKLVPDSRTALQGVIDEGVTYDFCMCNPPFFSLDEKPEARTDHRGSPSNAHSGTNVELHTDGGEVAFVTRIIDDSALLKDRIRIYTTMVGKRSSLKILKTHLENCGVKSCVVTEFKQGKTRRWGLAWSYSLELQCQKVEVFKKKKKPNVKPFTHPLPSETTCTQASDRIPVLLTQLKASFEVEESHPWTCNVSAFQNTWTNLRRSRRQQSTLDESPPAKKIKSETLENCEPSPQVPILQFLCKVLEDSTGSTRLELTWLSGEAGKNGLYQVLQYFKNNWSAKKILNT